MHVDYDAVSSPEYDDVNYDDVSEPEYEVRVRVSPGLSTAAAHGMQCAVAAAHHRRRRAGRSNACVVWCIDAMTCRRSARCCVVL